MAGPLTNLPPPLQFMIQEANTALQKHVSHELLPVFRQQIYRAMEDHSPSHSRQERLRLDILSARYVLPVWFKYRPNDLLSLEWITYAEDFSKGLLTQDEVAREASHAQYVLDETLPFIVEELDEDAEGPTSVLYTCFRALNYAAGITSFEMLVLDETSTDTDFDPWSSDTAKWAAIAYAGAPWDEDSSAEKRLAYWEWWLLQAIPSSWS